MFYIKMASLGIWLIICCIIGLIKSVFRWGDTELGKEFGQLYSWGALKISNVTLQVEGLENLEANQPCVYTLNHQSNFDLVIYGGIYPSNTVVIGKKELLWIPLFGLFYKAAGNIMINRSKTDKAKNVLSQVVDEIKNRKVSVWIFPEGTRNKSGEGLLPFKKGSFHMAVAAQVPVVPLVCSSVNRVADWKRKKLAGGSLKVKILPPIPTNGLTENDVDNLTEEVREKMLAALNEIEK